MSDDVTNWTELREFVAVDLEQSFVVAWKTEGKSLLIDLDVFLLPEHAFYEEPRPAEGACFRPAVIEFAYCAEVTESGKDGANSVADAISSLKAGRIAGLRCTGDGLYEIFGEFGNVGINAERPLLRVTSTDRRNTIILTGIDGVFADEKKLQACRFYGGAKCRALGSVAER